MKEVFAENVKLIKSYGSDVETVASHRYFISRKLKLINNTIKDDQDMRGSFGAVLETDEAGFINSLGCYISDLPYPAYYSPKSIFDALGNYDVLCFLSHPRHSKTNWRFNTKDSGARLCEGIKWLHCAQ